MSGREIVKVRQNTSQGYYSSPHPRLPFSRGVGVAAEFTFKLLETSKNSSSAIPFWEACRLSPDRDSIPALEGVGEGTEMGDVTMRAEEDCAELRYGLRDEVPAR